MYVIALTDSPEYVVLRGVVNQVSCTGYPFKSVEQAKAHLSEFERPDGYEIFKLVKVRKPTIAKAKKRRKKR